MNIFLLLILIFISGMGLSIQATMNGALGKSIGSLTASLISVFVSVLFILITGVLTQEIKFEQLLSVPKWQLLGGIFGALYIVTIAFSIGKINVQLVIAIAVLGQILMSAVVDHFGLFGLQQDPINWLRFIGLVFLLIGVIFIYKGSMKLH